MQFKEYIPLARVTLKELPLHEHFVHMTMGVVGEVAGELVDAMKKAFIYGKARDPINEMEEFGDACWYIANLMPEMEVSPTVLQHAVEKGYEAGAAEVAAWQAAGSPLPRLALAITQLSISLGAMMLELVQRVGDGKFTPGDAKSAATVEVIGQIMGFIAGMLGIDVAQALDRNIAKLKARYGDKFTQQAALQRDLSAERAALEGGEISHQSV